jgi:hypothetical protein
MELIDRYLQAVRFWLPKNQKQDIIAELSEDIRSQVEDREADLGRKLNQTEVAELLQQRGRPVLVANRFLPQESLIGPTLFTIYKFVLKMVALFYMLPWILMWIVIGLSRAHSDQDLGSTFGSFWTSFWSMVFFWIGAVTIVFAVLERVQAKSKFMEKWDPRKLPPVRDPNRIKLSNSVGEVTINIVLCTWWLWWAGGHLYPSLVHFPGITVTLAPVWRYFFWGYLLVFLATIQRAVFRLVSDTGGCALCWVMKFNVIVAITVVNVTPEKTARVAQIIDSSAAKLFPVALAVCAIIVLFDVYRILRVRATAAHPVALNTASGTC